MTEKFYIDANGAYIGGFVGTNPPEGAVEVPTAPQDAEQIWDGEAWGEIPLAPLQPITQRQLRLTLISAGLYSAAEAALAAIENEAERLIAQTEFNYASEFQPDHPLVETIRQALTLSLDEMETMWRQAEQL
jgi:hypothetical protein